MAFPLSWREKNQQLDAEQNIGSLLDGCEPFVALLPDTVQNLNLAVTGNQYNELFASLLTGVELTYPEKYLELVALFLQASQCPPLLPSENECYEYPSYAPFISYEPTSPFIDNGFSIIYPVAPFFLWSHIDTWLPNWLDDLFFGLLSNATGYQENDILISYLSQPLLANPFDGLDYPEIQIRVSGEGTARIHLLQIPYGGRAIISVDDPPDLTDIVSAIFTDNDRIVELNRDFSSFPPETDVDTIEDIEITGLGEHIIYISFVPTLDIDNAVFLQFGGGFRSVELCGFNQTGVIMGITDMRRVGEKLEVFDNGVWLEKVDLAPLHSGLQNQITANDNDITNLQNADTNLQNQITANDGDIVDIQNINTTQSSDIIALYAENDIQDIDIATNALDIANNDIDIQTLGNSLLNTNAYVNTNINDISLHDTRITALENAPSGGGGGGELSYVQAENSYIVTASFTTSSGIFSDVDSVNFKVSANLKGGGITFVTMSFLGRQVGSLGANQGDYQISVNGIFGRIHSVKSNDGQDTYQTNVTAIFDGLTSGNADFVLLWRTSGSSLEMSKGIFNAHVFELSSSDILTSPLVNFENDGADYLQTSLAGTVTLDGNPLHCLSLQNSQVGDYLEIEVDLGISKDVTGVSFDYLGEISSDSAIIQIFVDDVFVRSVSFIDTGGLWGNENMQNLAAFGRILTVRYNTSNTVLGDNIRIDNIQFTTS